MLRLHAKGMEPFALGDRPLVGHSTSEDRICGSDKNEGVVKREVFRGARDLSRLTIVGPVCKLLVLPVRWYVAVLSTFSDGVVARLSA